MALVAPATTPTVAVARALKRAGLEQGKGKDFQVKGRYRDGERKFTYVRVYGNQAAAVIAERADDIEQWTSDAGFPFKVSVRYMGRHTILVDVTNGPGERVRETAPAVEEPAVEAPATPAEEPAVQEEPAGAVDLAKAPSCPPGLHVVNLISTRLHDWYGVECGRCVPGVRHSLPGKWNAREDALLAARSHYDLEHRSADEALTPAELEELERWPLSSAQRTLLFWVKQGYVYEYEDGVWGLDVVPDRWDVNKRVARPRVAGLWMAGLIGVRGDGPGRRFFVLTDTGRRLHRLHFLAERQGHDLEAARDARLPVLEGRERGYPFLSEGRYFVGEERPEPEAAPEPEPAVQEEPAPPAEEPASPAVEEPEPAVSYAEDYLQERQASALGWSTRHAEVVRWAAAGELRMDGPDTLRRVTTPGRAGRRVAAALLRPLTRAGFLTLGELDEEARHRVEATADGRRALLVWDRKQPAPAVISRKQEGAVQFPPLPGGEEARRRSAEFKADLQQRAAEREAWYAAWEIRRAAEEFQERCDDAWAAVQGIRYRLGRHAPAGWTPTDEEVRLHGLDADVVAHLQAEAARLAAEAAAEPVETSTAPAAVEAVQEPVAPSTAPAARAPELGSAYVRPGAPCHTVRRLRPGLPLQALRLRLTPTTGRPHHGGPPRTLHHRPSKGAHPMRNYATARNIGGRSHQCDVTTVVAAPGNVRAYVLLDGAGSSPEVAHWTRGAALRLGTLAARHKNAEAGLRAAYALYANDPARRDPWAEDLPHAAAVVAVTAPGKPLTVAWSGDARAYLWSGGGFRRLTEDHNLRRTHPPHGRKNILTACLGATDTDVLLQDIHGHPAVESVTRDLTGRERLFLMSDGAYEPIEESTLDLEDFAPGALEDVPGGIVEAAVEMWGEDADNATALVADLWY